MKEFYCINGHDFDSTDCQEKWNDKFFCPYCHPISVKKDKEYKEKAVDDCWKQENMQSPLSFNEF